MSEIIVNLGSKKCENNYTSSFKLTCQRNLLLMSTVDTHKNYLSNVDRKHDIIKFRTFPVNSSSTLFSHAQFIIELIVLKNNVSF